jgi:hypothetical protein
LNINLGCGDRYMSGWTNVDLPGMPHRADQRVDLSGELPWPAHSVACVYAGHVLEHMMLADCHALLTRLRHCMIDNGAVMVVGPDIDRARTLFAGDDIPDQYGVTLNDLRFGAGRWAGDTHLWECTEAGLVALLEDAGWVKVTPIGVDEAALLWPVADPRPRWQCAVAALAPRGDR